MSMADEPSYGSETPAPKFSRYRSLRGKSVSTIQTTPANPANQDVYRTQSRDDPSTSGDDPVSADSIARSMSRYRRRAASVSGDNNATQSTTAPQRGEQPAVPPVPAIPSILKADSSGRHNFSFPKEKVASVAAVQDPPSSSPSRDHRQLRHAERATRDLNRLATADDRPSNESGRRTMAGHDDRERRRQEEKDAIAYAQQVARNERGKGSDGTAKSKKKDLERLHVSAANGQQQPDLRSPKTRSPVVEKFVALTRRRKSKEGLSPTSSTTGSVAGSMEYTRDHAEPPPKVPKLPAGIEVGGKGIVPQKDAPVSAVNHGDRIVSVRCRHHTFILPITPQTTPDDIILATSKNMTYDLEWSPSDCVVLESYGPLGLERRIRRFENIRDVMNSWDRDTHNQLIVSKSNDPNQNSDLDIDSVPDSEEPPKGVQLYMHHSNRPGKWNKRWITLTDNGQIISAKKPDANATDKDTLSLCHLSDYDIYTPTEAQMRKHLKSPKKHCFAVKSQHKPAMFVDTENYVQYFSTEDPQIAAQFAVKVQCWRSWYLVDRRPPVVRRISIPKTDDKPPQIPVAKKHAPKKSISIRSQGGHRLMISVDETPYTIGEFEPLLDMRRFDKRLSHFGQDFLPPEPDRSALKQMPSHAEEEPEESKPDGALIDKIKSANEDAFTGNGLLGQGYEARKASLENQQHSSKEARDTKDKAFTDGPSLLNKQAEAPPKPEINWFPSAVEHSAKHREPPKLRPSTSAGALNARPSQSRSRSYSQSRAPPVPQQSHMRSDRPPISNPHLPGADSYASNGRYQGPKPLLNLTTHVVNEPPQWARKGHGVQTPEGIQHLVDLISISPNGQLEIPPRNVMRRGSPNTALLPSGTFSTTPTTHRSNSGVNRTRSKSSSTPSNRPLIDDVPPVPILPGAIGVAHGGRTMTMGDKERAKMDAMREAMKARERDFKERERGRARDRERDRGREVRNEYNSTGRAGTLKVI